MEGFKYKKNEVFLDVIEKVNMLIGSNSNVIKSEINGSLHVQMILYLKYYRWKLN